MVKRSIPLTGAYPPSEGKGRSLHVCHTDYHLLKDMACEGQPAIASLKALVGLGRHSGTHALRCAIVGPERTELNVRLGPKPCP